MEENFKNNLFKKNSVIIGIGITVLAIIIISISMILYQNHVRRTEIVEIENLPADLPKELRDSLETKLKNLLKNNFDAPDDAVISANMREGTYNKDEDKGITEVGFLVDIDEYKQTYDVMVSWSKEEVIPEPILIACPSKKLMKYPEARCIATYNSSQDLENIADNPIYEKLPIIVDYFDYYSRKGIRYEVRGYFNEDNELILMVVDYSGGNLENAKKKIKELGYNPNDYTIKYVDESGKF